MGTSVFVILLGGLAAAAIAQDSPARDVTVWLEVSPFELADSLTAVRVMVSIAEPDSTPFLLSATVEVDYDDDRFRYRAAISGDLKEFLADWLEQCTERTGRRSDCLTMMPYRVNHNDLNIKNIGGRVRTDIYTSLGYDAKMGEPGMRFGKDAVAIALYIFESIGGGSEDDSSGAVTRDDVESFTIYRRSATISLYTGRDANGGIGKYVDCQDKSETCPVRFAE